jgi:hypothetical protein
MVSLCSNNKASVSQKNIGFGLSFKPDPSSPPLINHACPYTTVGFNVTITRPPPYPSFNPTSRDVTTKLMANVDTHLQKYEKRRLDGTTKPTQPQAPIQLVTQ